MKISHNKCLINFFWRGVKRYNSMHSTAQVLLYRIQNNCIVILVFFGLHASTNWCYFKVGSFIQWFFWIIKSSAIMLYINLFCNPGQVWDCKMPTWFKRLGSRPCGLRGWNPVSAPADCVFTITDLLAVKGPSGVYHKTVLIWLWLWLQINAWLFPHNLNAPLENDADSFHYLAHWFFQTSKALTYFQHSRSRLTH